MEENNTKTKENTSQKPIVSAIILAGVIIALAILLKDSKAPVRKDDVVNNNGGVPVTTLAPISATDMTLGNPQAKVAMIVYEDYQCPFCDRLFKETEKNVIDTYVKNGSVQFVYRDFAFLGPESERAAQAARCAGDQGKFWEYHDYLFNNQNGENQGGFADPKLKSFANTLGLEPASFDKCFDGNKYEQAVIDAKNEGDTAGVSGTPKGFILRDGKIVDTIDGAEPYSTVKQKLDSALK